MIEIKDTADLVDPVVIAAFEGWNDAAESASSVVDHLIEVWGARIVGAIDPEEFYDFQVNRPLRRHPTNPGIRHLTWPTTQIAVASPPDLDRDVILIRGIEPNMRWRQFCAELLAAVDDLGGELVVTLGALLADTPHTRPVPVTRDRHRARARRPAASWSSRPTRGPPASSGSSRTPASGSTSRRCPTGPRFPTTWPSRRAPRRRWPCSASSRTCSR